MNKKQFTDHVRQRVGSVYTRDDVVDAVFDSIAELVMQGEVISIRNFGRFEAPMKPAREARNPKTGETVQVPARRRPKFKASPNFVKD